jgi:microcin C transport system ATP-binding protein
VYTVRQSRCGAGITFHIEDGETVALVGESGSGKSATALAILQLLPYPMASHPRGSIRLAGQEVIGAPDEALRRLRGAVASMIFQEPMTSLNRCTRSETDRRILIVHRGLDQNTRAGARVEAVHLPEPEERLMPILISSAVSGSG